MEETKPKEIKKDIGAEHIRPLPVRRIVMAFIIANIIFFAGFYWSYSLYNNKYQSVAIDQEQIRYSLLSLELEKQLLTSSCNLPDFYSYSKELDNLGSSISLLEEKYGKNDKKVLDQKKIYSMLEIQHFLLIKNYNEKCKSKKNILLFFYSNDKKLVDEAEKMGYILTTFKQKNNDTMIYSFDYNLDSSLIRTLKAKYNVTQADTVIINEKNKMTNLVNINEIDKYIK
jgi:hypothetical protein